jgi:hypothetical protein
VKGEKLHYYRNVKCVVALFVLLFSPLGVRAETPVDIGGFANVTAGHYQVFAQSGPEIAGQVNGYMNAMLQLYSQYFSNWTVKDGARVVVFNNLDDFRDYSRDSVGVTHRSLLGYCHLKTDEDGNTFYELVTYEHTGLWQVLAHEGFHQFLGYELGREIPVWLNEGMAQYFETSTVKNGRLVPDNIDRRRLAMAQALIVARRAPAISSFLTMDRRTFYGDSAVTYPMSWALVHYLMTRDGSSYRNGQFRRYLQDLKWSRDSVASFSKRFGRDSAQWQSDFEHFIVNAGNFR